MGTIAKTVTITDGGDGNPTKELEIPADRVTPRLTNDITSFAKPQATPPERRALNLNRIELQVQVQATLDDAFADKNHNGSGNRPDLANKEDWMLELYNLATSQDHLKLKSVNDNTHGKTSEWTGYLHNVEWPEKASTENSIYDITIKFVKEVPMNT